MTPIELKTARHALGLSAEGFARLVRVSGGRTVRRWEAGDCPIPGSIEVVLRLHRALTQIATANPYPEPGKAVPILYRERDLENMARAALGMPRRDLVIRGNDQ